MPCCTLIAFVLSQFGLAAGAVKMRFFGIASVASLPQVSLAHLLQGWRAAGLAGALVFELAIGFLAAPYVFTDSGRIEAANSFATAWHICQFGASKSAALLQSSK